MDSNCKENKIVRNKDLLDSFRQVNDNLVDGQSFDEKWIVHEFINRYQMQ